MEDEQVLPLTAGMGCKLLAWNYQQNKIYTKRVYVQKDLKSGAVQGHFSLCRNSQLNVTKCGTFATRLRNKTWFQKSGCNCKTTQAEKLYLGEHNAKQTRSNIITFQTFSSNTLTAVKHSSSKSKLQAFFETVNLNVDESLYYYT